MESQTAAPTFPASAYTPSGNSDKLTSYTVSPDLEAQKSSWAASPPPTYLPSWLSQPAVVTARNTQQRTRSSKCQRKGLACCLLLAFLIVAIFLVITIVEVVARINAQVNNR